MYKINITGFETAKVIKANSCMNTSCSMVFTEFSASTDQYELMIVVTNHSQLLKKFNLKVGKYTQIKALLNWQLLITCTMQLITVKNTLYGL